MSARRSHPSVGGSHTAAGGSHPSASTGASVRAQALGGTLTLGPDATGFGVALRVPR